MNGFASSVRVGCQCAGVVLVGLVGACPGQGRQPVDVQPAVAFSVEMDVGKVTVRCGELAVAVYRFADGSRPVVYPLRGLDGVERTRRWPIGEAREGEAKDHPHHRSVWFAHGDVNGHDFWAEGKGKGRVEHVELVRAGVERGRAVIVTRNRWVAADGTVVCTDRRRLAFGRDVAGLTVDFAVTVFADHGALRFGDTKEGTMAVRLHPALRLRGAVAAGSARNSEGVTGKAVWGKRAKWVDYHGVIDGKAVGLAMFDHPTSPSYPTWWHARDYGLVAANPFGVHDFERAPAGTGDRVVPNGESLVFRYRILLHGGETTDVSKAHAHFARSKARRGVLR